MQVTGRSKVLMAGIGTMFFVSGGFLAFQTWRAERAAIGIDLYSGLANDTVAKARMDQAGLELKEPRDARLWELEADRLIKLNLDENDAAARRALGLARELAPMRPSIRMREAYLALRKPESPDTFNGLFVSWYKLAPYDVTIQDWRLSIAAAGWSRLSAEARLMALADAEALCMRWGRQRTVEFVGAVAQGPAIATALRLERVKQKCIGG